MLPRAGHSSSTRRWHHRPGTCGRSRWKFPRHRARSCHSVPGRSYLIFWTAPGVAWSKSVRPFQFLKAEGEFKLYVHGGVRNGGCRGREAPVSGGAAPLACHFMRYGLIHTTLLFAGRMKNCISICSNSRVKMNWRAVISFPKGQSVRCRRIF